MGVQSSKDLTLSASRTGYIKVIPISDSRELELHHIPVTTDKQNELKTIKGKKRKHDDEKEEQEPLKLFVPDPIPESSDYIRTIKQIPTDTLKFPIVYSTEYDISFFQLEKILHKFDAQKYGKVYRSLATEYGFGMTNIYSPEHEVSEADLLKVHTKTYLDSLSTSSVVASIAEVPPLALFPNYLIQRKMLSPMRYATEGTTLAAKLALQQYGWAINLGGGYHHAKTSRGEGFCVYADIPLAVHHIMKDPAANFGVERVMVVDLDAHQGNGFQTLFTSPDTASTDSTRESTLTYHPTDNIQIFDMYNGEIYPGDRFAKKFITFDYPLKCGTKDRDYLETLSTDLPAAINNCRPDIVFYNAGTDIYEKDSLGQLSISREAIIARDEIVFRLCRKRNIPIVMVLSGGYTMASADIIASSIKNLHEKGIISLAPAVGETA